MPSIESGVMASLSIGICLISSCIFPMRVFMSVRCAAICVTMVAIKSNLFSSGALFMAVICAVS